MKSLWLLNLLVVIITGANLILSKLLLGNNPAHVFGLTFLLSFLLTTAWFLLTREKFGFFALAFSSLAIQLYLIWYFGGSQVFPVPIGLAVSVMFPLAIIIAVELRKFKRIAGRLLLGGVVEMGIVFGVLHLLGDARLHMIF
jgi:hypothetical protein